MLAKSPKKPNPIDIEVGARIRLRRKILGMSQETVAEHIGVTFQQLQKYEKGTNRVGASRLHQIAEALKVSPAHFLGDDKPVDDSTDEIMSFIRSSEGIALNRAFVSIADETTRKRIIDLVKAIAA